MLVRPMLVRKPTRSPSLAAALLAPFVLAAAPGWRDPSPHAVQFIPVEKDVRLEVLDWGGSGRPIVLLAGGGNTGHVFDELAPQLGADGHVFAITRRGFGASEFKAPESAVERLRDDVLAVLDALRLERPVLVGHSIAGAELSEVARARPDRVAGLVYLEAAYPYAFRGENGPTMEEFQHTSGPQPPSPAPADLVSFRALRRWDARVYGFHTPEAEFRQTWLASPEGRPSKPREAAGMPLLMTVLTNPGTATQLPVPALVLFASPHRPDAWIQNSADPAVRDAARDYSRALDALTESQVAAVATGMPTARVVRLPGAHYIFLSNRADVLREMRVFLRSLRDSAPRATDAAGVVR
jgi:non-heme chloroperoxidase